MLIHCCGCGNKVDARLTAGDEIYPHRPDLYDLPFWKCDACGNHVGCHHKTKDSTRPLGNIATPEIKNARQHIHKLLDPIWKSGSRSRGSVYAEISRKIGREYHTGEIESIDEARRIYVIIKEIAQEHQA
jgi:hypothetical protein